MYTYYKILYLKEMSHLLFMMCVDNETNHFWSLNLFSSSTVVMDDEDGRCLLDVIW